METTLTIPRPSRPGPRERYPARVVLRRRAGTAATSDLPGLDEAFASGEADLETVYRAHAPLVHAICRRTLDEHSAAEVTQDVFLSVWRARDQFDPRRGSLGAWIVGITRRRVIDHVRARNRHADRRADGVVEFADGRVDTELGRTIDRIVVADALATLPDRVREVVVLAYVEGLTHREIVERTRLPLGTVKSDIRRGLARIRERLEASHA